MISLPALCSNNRDHRQFLSLEVAFPIEEFPGQTKLITSLNPEGARE
jgi:hypothetical protein